MKAVIETGGKQYVVSVGDVLHVERLPEAEGSITIDRVLSVLDGENSRFGAPYVEGATVTATVLKHGKGKKIRVFKYKAKKNYRRRIGHRQPYTRLQIDAISG